ncbi:hypothetical protein RclHR1_22500004 [Rhizophagus clarus]|uniref:Highly derived d5-like helicase-primase: PROVISIONAL n=1 Tax=Rhizophagus clarus TaxID=94130 RepID=A0A2Z6QUJ6_9GLOM|nr:hypothetical protein RclHR1_22500004 [Rhizophagus clarus]
MLIRPITKTFFKQSDPEQPPIKIKFNIAYWFLHDNSFTCVATCDPAKKRIYKIQGQNYLNIFPGFLHQLRPLTDFSANIHRAVKSIFTHIRDIWCSGDWNLTEYIIKWFAGVASAKKMYSLLYLKSGQGWGKGTITEFIQRYVLGTQLVYKTSDPEIILDVSPARKGDKQYFKQLNNAMKYPGVGEAFYAYLKVIADKYPDFNGNPPPMTASKQEHIVSTLPPLFQFIKETYIAETDYMTTCLPVHILYATYTSYCENRRITPLSKVVVARTLSSELNMTSNLVKLNGKCTRVYNISRETLYKKYLSNNWIHETDEIDIEEIDIPKKSVSDPKALDQFLAQIGIDIPNEQKKSSPPVPSKSEQEETEDQPVTSESVENLIDNFITELITLIPPSAKSEEEPKVEQEPEIEPEPYGTPGPSTELPLKQDPKSVQKANPDPMPKMNTAKYWEWIDRHKYDHIKPWYKNSRDDMINELYSVSLECWAKYMDEEAQYDWELLLAELEEFDKIARRDNLQISCCELADYLRRYNENKETVFVEPPSGYKVAKLQPQIIECHSTINERECMEANGDESDYDEDGAFDEIDQL